MNKIILNETHIRQIVRETLENLILGEDDIDDDFSDNDITNILANSEIISVRKYDWDYDGYGDKASERMEVILNPNNNAYSEMRLDFYVELHITEPYMTFAGDYYSPPEYAESELVGFEFKTIDIDFKINKTGKHYYDTIEDYNIIPENIFAECCEYVENDWNN
jgi:hypothetical protein